MSSIDPKDPQVFRQNEKPAGSPGSSPPVSQSISVAMPQWGQLTRKGWWLLGGVLLVFIGSLLPWEQESVGGVAAVSTHPVAAAWPFFCSWRSAPWWPRGRC
jgi:hypothetical protein